MTRKPAHELMAKVLHLALVEKLSHRAISKKLSVARRTVRRILEGEPDGSKGRPSPRISILAPYDVEIRKLLDDAPDILAPAALERLRSAGFSGGVTVVRDRLKQLRPQHQREAFVTLNFAAGSALQVDWADFGFAVPGCPRRVSGFVMVLCHSRYLYLEFALSQSMGTFLRCMERGLRFFGGTTETEVFDNMKTVVLAHTPQAVTFNARFMEYARVRCFTPRACNVRRGNEKGGVERGIGFVRLRFWPGRRFSSILDLNVQASTWRDDFANNRIHEVTGKVPSLVFNNTEKRMLKPVTPNPFDTDDVDTCQVSKTFRIKCDRNQYSVPWWLVDQMVLVRANDNAVAVYLGPKQVALHKRHWGAGADIENAAHKRGVLERKPGAVRNGLPPALVAMGETGIKYFKVYAASSRSIHREVVRLTFLQELFGEEQTVSALAEVMESGHVGSEYVEYILRHRRCLVPSAQPLRLGDEELDGLSFPPPDLAAYDRVVPTAKTLDPASGDKGNQP